MTARQMNDGQRRVLRTLRSGLNWAPMSEHVWVSPRYHVEGLHRDAERCVLDGLEAAAAESVGSPVGVVVEGEGGAGKTHFLGWVRQQVHSRGGYFFLIDFSVVGEFWPLTARAMVEDLGREQSDVVPAGGAAAIGPPTQLSELLRRLAAEAVLDEPTTAAIAGDVACTRVHLDALLDGLRRRHRQLVTVCSDTLRALVLYGSPESAAVTIGNNFLLATPEAEYRYRDSWGMSRRLKGPQDIVTELSRILAVTGPSVIAVDQIDSFIEHTAKAVSANGPDQSGEGQPAGSPTAQTAAAALIEQTAGGLMALRQVTRRTLCLIACLPTSWRRVREQAVETVQDRFTTAPVLNTISDSATAHRLVERRFAPCFADVGFAPPHATWPISPDAFDTAPGHTPRVLLQRISAHLDACLRAEAVHELLTFEDASVGDGGASPTEQPEPRQVQPGKDDLSSFASLDARFAELCARADVRTVYDHRLENIVVPPLLTAGLIAWVRELGDGGRALSVDPPSGRRADVHARLRRLLDGNTEEQEHWAFRAIAATDPRSTVAALRHACSAAGIGPLVSHRTLIVLRNHGWPGGQKNELQRQMLIDSGGRSVPLSADDVRVFSALQTMLTERHPDLDDWLTARRPASGTELVAEVFRGVPGTPSAADGGPGRDPSPGDAATTAEPPSDPVTRHGDDGPVEPDDLVDSVPSRSTDSTRSTAMRVGVALREQTAVEIELATLRKHAVVFAGSGSGKTVLLRRLVEECALRGVSSIVLDPNNDLARLGDRWPSPPDGWEAGDAARADEYLQTTDVVVWTPGLTRGRPLAFQPLPDFAAVRDDPDAFEAAIDLAVGELAPRVGADGSTTRAGKIRAVLTAALRHFGRQGGAQPGGGLPALIALLRDLPLDVSKQNKAEQTAVDIADALDAAMVNDRQFAGVGETADPGVLLTPAPGKRARVSVISMVGLGDDLQRAGFVSQLQTALFTWIRRHPATDKPLGGLYVIDEAQTLAPPGGRPPALTSTLTLAAQARKYGLGLVFATQAPKGVHSRIVGNATTQFFGKLNSPAHVSAAREMARAKGGNVDRIGRLERGQFFVTSDGMSFVLTQTPQCLSYHPASPLTAEEVVERARRGTGHP
ncbi:ATP-binding protein [Frankia sp. AvcI1]|uniref:ATP-binding protein n=1 Tax=Frankia sp. AvcI1 TaxID=573496 RepID=UPI0021178243|nr:DUF87 domain-containing protein [Frankia sp. AvcI1]